LYYRRYQGIYIHKIVVKAASFIIKQTIIEGMDVVRAGRLLEAARHGDIVEVVRIVKADPEVVNLADEVGNTALHYSSGCGDVCVVTYLLDHGANVNLGNHYRLTALYRACLEGHLEVADVLVTRGADPTVQTTRLRTPLMITSFYENVKMVRFLLGLRMVRAAIDAQEEDGATALHNALIGSVSEKRVEVVKLLVGAGANPMVADKIGRTPMDVAKTRGLGECIKILQVRQGVGVGEEEVVMIRHMLQLS